MKILIYSEACFNDNIFPLFKAMTEKGHDVTCLINLSILKVMLFNIEHRINKQSIIKATEYPELRKYEQYMNMDKVYLVNHQVDRKHAWRDLTSTIDIIKFINRGKYDVIHIDHNLWRSKTLLYFYRNRIVNIVHDTFPHSGAKLTFERSIYMFFKFHIVKQYVLLNESDYDKFCVSYKIPKERVAINYLGPLDCIRMYINPSINEQKNNVLFFGRIAPYKGVEYLCEAFKKVHDVIPDATLTIAGGGDFYFDVKPYENLKYIKIINRFLDEEELAHLIQQCSVSSCVYTDATQSGGVLTSFSFCKPVLASDISTMREVVKDKYNGIIVPPKNPDALANAIIELLNNSDLRKLISRNIEYELYHGDKSWSNIVDRYIQIYKSFINKK